MKRNESKSKNFVHLPSTPTSRRFDFDAIIPQICTVGFTSLLGQPALDAPWSQLFVGDLGDGLAMLDDDDTSTSRSKSQAKRRWDGLLSRIFTSDSPGSASASSSSSTLAVGRDDDAAALRARITELLQDHLMAHLPSLIPALSNVNLPQTSSISASVSSSSPSNVSRSFKSSFLSSAMSADRQHTWRATIFSFAKEYAQSQLIQAAYVWNLLSDTVGFPRSSSFANCSCRNCYRSKRRRVSQQPIGHMTHRSPILTTILPVRSASRRENHIVSRYQYVSNVIQRSPPRNTDAITPNDHSEVKASPSFDSHLVKQFAIVESFYVAIEELGFPAPVGFHTKFILLGFHAMERQYRFL